MVNLFQSLHARMRVDLRTAQRRVAEQLLHRPQIGTGIEEVRREGMPQRVYSQLITADRVEQVVHQPLDAARR
jgi:putative NIF3 family GTP cyclohydrolase 1 type 2